MNTSASPPLTLWGRRTHTWLRFQVAQIVLMVCVWGWGKRSSDQTNSGFWRKSGSKNNSLCLWGAPAGLGSVFLSSTHCNGWGKLSQNSGTWLRLGTLPSCCRDGKKAPWQRGRWEKAGDWEHEDVYTGQWVGQAACDRVQCGDGGK